MDKSQSKPTKRQQIAKSNRLMFVWISGVSVVVGFSIVIALFLVQKISYEEKVLSKKQNTLNVLTENITAVPELEKNIQLLAADENLNSIKYKDSEETLSVVLDALPPIENSTALASSLQSKILTGVPGVSIDSLKMDTGNGVAVPAQGANSASGSNATNEGTIDFTFSVGTPQGNQSALRTVLLNVERSIRPINITSITIESQGNRIVMTVSGVGYYQPEKKVQLIREVVRP